MTYEPDYPPEPPSLDYEMDLPPEAYHDPEPPPDSYNHEPEPLPDDYANYEPEPFFTTYASTEPPEIAPPEPPAAWIWHDARFVGLAQVGEGDDLTGYEVGCVEWYANRQTGELDGRFLPVQAFGPDELDLAEDLFNRLNEYSYEQNVDAHHLPDLAERAAAKIATREGIEPAVWRVVTDQEYAAFEPGSDHRQPLDADVPPEHIQADLLRTAYEVSGIDLEVEEPAHYPAAQALEEIGLAPDGFDPDHDPPPYYDAATNTAYWIGVYQPDPDDPEVCVASILSLTRDPATGDYEAQLAPCVVGDWDRAYAASEHLIGVAERSDDIERVFEAAEGMAIASNQRDEWQHARGVELEPDSAQDLGEYAAQQWELDL